MSEMEEKKLMQCLTFAINETTVEQKSWKGDVISIARQYSTNVYKFTREDFLRFFEKYPDIKRFVNNSLSFSRHRI